MDVQHQRCAGLDVHKRTVVACVRLTTAEGVVQQEVRTFGTMTADLLTLDDWLTGFGVEHVALESTGVYTPPTMLQKRERNGSRASRSCIATPPAFATFVRAWATSLKLLVTVVASSHNQVHLRQI
jgi:hypothetical protein